MRIILILLILSLLIGCVTDNNLINETSHADIELDIFEDTDGMNLRFNNKRPSQNIYAQLFFCYTEEGERVDFSLSSGTKSGWIKIPDYLTYNRPDLECGVSFYKCPRDKILESNINKCNLKINELSNLKPEFNKTYTFDFR